MKGEMTKIFKYFLYYVDNNDSTYDITIFIKKILILYNLGKEESN